MAAQAPRIRVGIGGWTFPPWRGTFYPKGLPQARELAYAAGQVTAIEINGTFYRTQSPASFAKWRDETPDGFVFSLKAPRYATHRRALAEAGESIERFVGSGIAELGDKLGPILWQMAPTKKFEPDDMAAFLAQLPTAQAGLRLRHAIEVKHESFTDPAFADLARKAGVALVHVDATGAPKLAADTADFVYARLKAAEEEIPTGYAPAALDAWLQQARTWTGNGRDGFVYFINGAKVRAPAAAMALLERLIGS